MWCHVLYIVLFRNSMLSHAFQNPIVLIIFKMDDSIHSNEEDADPSAPALVPAPGAPASAPPRQRQRTVLEPLDPSLLHTRMITNTNEISINTLMSEEVFNININRTFIDVQVSRIIIPNQQQKATIYNIRRRHQTDVHFKRIYQCSIFSRMNITDNSRIIYLMESKNSNNVLFDRNLEYRDNGTITVGSFLKILAPQPIDNVMNGDVPLVKTPHPLIVLKRPSAIPSISIINEIQSHKSLSFVFNNRHLSINQSYVVSTSCGGNHCDKQRINDWNGIKGCGCFSMSQNTSNLAVIHSIRFAGTEANPQIGQSEFSSTKFSLCYLSNRFPSMVQRSALQHTDAFWDMDDCIQNVVDFVNDNGGWTIVGWYKRGSIKDKSLIEATTNNGANDETVSAGQLNFHIVEVLPTNNRILDPNHHLGANLNRLKYDVSNLNHA